MSAADLISEYEKDEAERSFYIYTIDPSRRLDIEAVRALHDSSDIENIEDDDASIPEDSGHSPREKRSSDLLEDGAEERRTRQRR